MIPIHRRDCSLAASCHSNGLSQPRGPLQNFPENPFPKTPGAGGLLAMEARRLASTAVKVIAAFCKLERHRSRPTVSYEERPNPVINPGGLCLFTFLLLPLVRAQEASTPAKPAQKYDAAVSVSQPQGAVQHPSLASQEPEGLIHLDVMVTDPTGTPVSGLKAADFAVLDKGQPKKIVSFHAYDGVSAKPDPPVKIILVLDMLEAPELASQVRDSARAFLRENGGHLAQPTSVLLLTRTGLSRVGLSPTDGNALAESITRDRETPWNPAKGNLSTRIDQTWEASQAPYMAPGFPWYATPGASGGPKRLDPSAEAALKALGLIATTQRRQPGRKFLIWLGPGWGMGSGNSPNEKDGSGNLKEKEAIEQKQMLFDKVVWFSTLLRLAGVRVYSFSVGEKNLMGFPSLAPYAPVTSPAQATVFDLNRKVLAIESGGRVLKPGTDLVRQIDDCVREANAFYTLSFDPAPAEHPDEYHDLKIVIASAKARDQSRDSFPER